MPKAEKRFLTITAETDLFDSDDVTECGYAGWGLHNCDHQEDAGLSCWNIPLEAPETEVDAAEEDLTAASENRVSEHDGENPFTFNIRFNQAVSATAANMRDHAIAVTAGSVTKAVPEDPRSGLWAVTVQPSGDDTVTITLTPGRDCDQDNAICTEKDFWA